MSDILDSADEIHRDLITTAHRWTLQLSSAKPFRRQKTPDQKETYHVLLNILGLSGQVQQKQPQQQLTMNVSPKPDSTNPKCPYCDLQHNLLSCDHRKKDKAIKEQLGPLIVVVSQVQELLNKILPQLGQGNLRSQDASALKHILNNIWDKPTAPIYLAGKRLQDWTKRKDTRGRQISTSNSSARAHNTARSITPARPTARHASPPARRNQTRTSTTGRSQSQDRRAPQTHHTRQSSTNSARRGGHQQRAQVQFSSNFLTAQPPSQHVAPTTFFCKHLLPLMNGPMSTTQGEYQDDMQTGPPQDTMLTPIESSTLPSTSADLPSCDLALVVQNLRLDSDDSCTTSNATRSTSGINMVPHCERDILMPTFAAEVQIPQPMNLQLQPSHSDVITPMMIQLSYPDDEVLSFTTAEYQASLGTLLYWSHLAQFDISDPMKAYIRIRSKIAANPNIIILRSHVLGLIETYYETAEHNTVTYRNNRITTIEEDSEDSDSDDSLHDLICSSDDDEDNDDPDSDDSLPGLTCSCDNNEDNKDPDSDDSPPGLICSAHDGTDDSHPPTDNLSDSRLPPQGSTNLDDTRHDHFDLQSCTICNRLHTEPLQCWLTQRLHEASTALQRNDISLDKYEDLKNEALKENPSGGAFIFTDTSSYWSLIEGYFVTAQHTHCSLFNPAHDGSC